MEGGIVDLEGQGLNSVQIPDVVDLRTLILDNNHIARLENLEKCSQLSQVSVIVWISFLLVIGWKIKRNVLE